MSSGSKIDEVAHGRAFLNTVLQNPHNRIILDRLAKFGLDDWWLTAGCLAQTVWNLHADRAPEAGIADYDLLYFDPDTSWEAEDAVIKQADALFSDLPIHVEIRNQARVPIWYPDKYGFEFGPVHAASDGIDRFAYQTTAIGLRKSVDTTEVDPDPYRLYAPFGLDAVMRGCVVPNPVLPVRAVYEAKVRRWQKLWPDLDVMPWPDGA
jgi:hypothetical protein